MPSPPTANGSGSPVPSGDSIRAYVAYPERKDPGPAIIVIHEIFGLTSWEPTVVDKLAAAGYVAIVPDLLSSRYGMTPADPDSGRKLTATLVPDQVTGDLNAAYGWLNAQPATRRDDIATIGFCWGGGQSFRYATNNPNLKAAVVCYGPAPDSAGLARIHIPILGDLWRGRRQDHRVTPRGGVTADRPGRHLPARQLPGHRSRLSQAGPPRLGRRPARDRVGADHGLLPEVPGYVILHLVLFRFRAGVPSAAIDAAREALLALQQSIPEIRKIAWSRNLGPSAPDYPFVLSVSLDDMAAVERYLTHPAHVDAVARWLAPIREARLAVDIEVP